MKRGLAGLVLGLILATAAGVGAQWQGAWSTLGYLATPLRFYAGTGPAITPASGTGISVVEPAMLTRVTYKVTVLYTQFTSAALTHDVTLATLPAKTRLVSILADLTDTFACAATCTSTTLSMTVGKTAGGTTYLVSFDADAATLQRGLVDADLGTDMIRATAIQGGNIPSWTAATAVSARLTSGTGNLGTGTATNLSKGTITFYLTTEAMP